MNRGTIFATIALAAGAAAANQLPTGMVIMHPSANGALSMSGNGRILLPSGQIFVNSTHNNALTASGNALFDVSAIHIRGGARFSGQASCTGQIIPANSPYEDPLAHTAIPDGSGMPNYGNRSINGGNVILQPGRYGSISISAHPTVTFQPGTYVINSLSVSGHGNIVGDGVTLVLHQNSISMSGQSTVTLSPPAAGPLAGVVIAQRAGNSSNMSLSGGGSLNITGAIYAPGASISLSGNGTVAAEGPLMGDLIIARTATLSGNGTIRVGRNNMRTVIPPSAPLFD